MSTALRSSKNPSSLLIGTTQLAALLEISVRTLWRLNSSGKLPKPFSLGGSTRWKRDEIVNWIDAHCPDRKTWEALYAGENK